MLIADPSVNEIKKKTLKKCNATKECQRNVDHKMQKCKFCENIFAKRIDGYDMSEKQLSPFFF